MYKTTERTDSEGMKLFYIMLSESTSYCYTFSSEQASALNIKIVYDSIRNNSIICHVEADYDLPLINSVHMSDLEIYYPITKENLLKCVL